MKFLISSSVLASLATLSNVCSTDSTLPVLSKIKVTVTESQMIGIATDRYKVARVGGPVTAEDSGEITFLIAARDLVALSKQFGRVGSLEVTIDLLGETMRLSSNSGTTGLCMIETEVGPYPAVDKLLDQILMGDRADVCMIGVNPAYLLALSKVRNAGNLKIGKFDPVFLEFNGPRKAFTLANTQELPTGEVLDRVIMPVNC